MGETCPGAFKSAGIRLLHSIMGYIYPGAFKSAGIRFTYTNAIKALGYDYSIPLWERPILVLLKALEFGFFISLWRRSILAHLKALE